MITFWKSTSAIPDAVDSNAYEYTKPETNPSILSEFLSIPGNISDSMRITDLHDIITELGQPGGAWYVWSKTIPLTAL